MLLLDVVPAAPDFSADGPVWKLVGGLIAAIGSYLGWQEWRRHKHDEKEENRKDLIVAIDEKFKDKVATQIERQNDILDSQANTLMVMAETQKRQGQLIDDLHKLSKEWSLLSKVQAGPGGPTVKLAGAEPHLHIETPNV